MKFRPASFFVVFAATLLAATPVVAGTVTWSPPAVNPSPYWTNSANWSPAPPSGVDTLIFGPSNLKQTINDFTNPPIAATGITITEPDYSLDGGALYISGQIVYSVAASLPSFVNLDLVQASSTLDIFGDDGAPLWIGNLYTSGSTVNVKNKVFVAGALGGPSSISVDGSAATYMKLIGSSESFEGTILVNPLGSLLVEGDYLYGSGTVFASAGSNLFLGNGGKFNALGSAFGGPGILANVHVGETSAGGHESGFFITSELHMSGGTLYIDINGPDPGSGYDQIFAQGQISLSNVNLVLRNQTGFVPIPGTSHRIIEVGFIPGKTPGINELSGTFNGLPNGSVINAGGVTFKIWYDPWGVSVEALPVGRHWIGNAGGPQTWSTAANWEEGAAPVDGSDLYFSDDVMSKSTVNDLTPGMVLGAIDISGPGYALSGNAILLARGIRLADASIPAKSVAMISPAGPAWIGMPITFAKQQTIIAQYPLTLAGPLTIASNTTLLGQITITGALSGSASLLAQEKGTTVVIETTSTATGSIQAQLGSRVRFKGSHKGSIAVQGDASAEVTGSATQLQISGLLLPGGEGTVGSASANSLTLNSSAKLRIDLSGTTADAIQAGSVTLGGATLELLAPVAPAPGATFRIVDNTGTAPVSGTFKGLAEGATVAAGGRTFAVSYKGGTGNDVVLTMGSGCSITISAAHSVRPGSTGNTATLVAPVAGSTYTWIVSNGTITAGQGTPSIVFTAGSAGSVQINLSVAGACAGSASHVATIDLVPASVILSSTPAAVVLAAGSGAGGSTGYALTNIGDSPATVSLAQSGAFFSQSPASFTLAGGASQTVSISVPPQASSGTFTGASRPSGSGVPAGLSVPVTLLVAAAPSTGTPNVVATIDRIDVSASRGENPRGSASFMNVGTAIANGTPASNVPWIIPDPSGVISIAPGASVQVGFTIDRSQRPDGSNPSGSVAGLLSFVYATSTAGSRGTLEGGSLAASVPVSDTVKPPTSNSVVPPLAPGELALVVPGVGNVVGSGGKLFVSDLTLLNKSPLSSLPDAKLYYIPPSGQSAEARLDPLGAGGSISLANVVSTVFNQSQQVGTLMVRSSRVSDIVVGATIFNDNNPRGRYGTVIPVLRSDAAVTPGQRLVINGISRDALSHTNLYIQEMAGSATSATIRFLGLNGTQVGNPVPVSLQPFALAQLPSVVPEGAVSAIIANDAGGALLSYATPVDDAPGGGDTWAQTDWNRQYNLSGAQPLLVPVAGAAPGANNSYFRTDVAITNSGDSTAIALVRYTSGPTVVSKSIQIVPLATAVLDDVVAGFLGVAPPSIGSLTIVPQGNGTFVVSSRTYTSTQGSDATFGTATPTVALSSGLAAGQSKLIAGIEDSKQSTVSAGTPKTARTNFGLVETTGQPATVRVSLFLNDSRSLAFGQARGSIDITLNPNEFRLVPSLTRTILGDARETQFGDLKNVMVRFDVVAGSGAVVPFVTSTDNGTNDTIFRNE